MKLWCKGLYKNGALGLYLQEGEIEVTDIIGAFLLRDAPENFGQWRPGLAEKALDEPPMNKAIQAAPRKKRMASKKRGARKG